MNPTSRKRNWTEMPLTQASGPYKQPIPLDPSIRGEVAHYLSRYNTAQNP
jgi:hypothetical protein